MVTLIKDGFIDVPVILVGNKIDQFNDRMVSTEDGQKRAKEIACACFHEISVRESIEQVIVFYYLYKLFIPVYFCYLWMRVIVLVAVFYSEGKKR